MRHYMYLCLCLVFMSLFYSADWNVAVTMAQNCAKVIYHFYVCSNAFLRLNSVVKVLMLIQLTVDDSCCCTSR